MQNVVTHEIAKSAFDVCGAEYTACISDVPSTPLGAGMVASLTVIPDDGVAVPENAPQDSPGIISAAASSMPIKNIPTRRAARQKTWLPVCFIFSPLLKLSKWNIFVHILTFTSAKKDKSKAQPAKTQHPA
jgi:hypothetical protein